MENLTAYPLRSSGVTFVVVTAANASLRFATVHNCTTPRKHFLRSWYAKREREQKKKKLSLRESVVANPGQPVSQSASTNDNDHAPTIPVPSARFGPCSLTYNIVLRAAVCPQRTSVCHKARASAYRGVAADRLRRLEKYLT